MNQVQKDKILRKWTLLSVFVSAKVRLIVTISTPDMIIPLQNKIPAGIERKIGSKESNPSQKSKT